MPTANIATNSTTASTSSFQPDRPKRRLIQPNRIATNVNRIEIVPAVPPAYDLAASTAPWASNVAWKVPATMSTNAAMTMIVNSQLNSRNSLRPVRPMYFSIS